MVRGFHMWKQIFFVGKRGDLELGRENKTNHLPDRSKRQSSSPTAPCTEVLVGVYESDGRTRGRGHYTVGWRLVHRNTHDEGTKTLVSSAPLPRPAFSCFASFDGPHGADPPHPPRETDPHRLRRCTPHPMLPSLCISPAFFAVPQPVAPCSGCHSSRHDRFHAACCNL